MKLFVTGASGFVGRQVLRRLAQRPQVTCILLLRDPAALPDLPANCTAIKGDLDRPDSYRAALEGADRVLHMAALTGKAAPAAYAAANQQATEALTGAAKAAGVKAMIFVSTIAAGYPDKRHYPYAQTKEAAETALAASGLPHTILRPTLVFGPGSPIAATLGKIAGAPIIPLPARGGPVDVQPVHVDDVARAIDALIDAEPAGEVLDLGGPERLSFRDFLTRMHAEITGKSPKFLPLPLTPLQALLAVMEPVARPVMPATAGQFAVFANHSAARDNWLMDRLRPEMVSLEDMLAEAISGDPPPPPARAPSNTTPPDPEPRDTLVQECRDISRHLCGTLPGPQAEAAYLDGIARFALTPAPGSFDAAVLRFSRRSPMALSLMDGYTSFFARKSLFRRRLILLLAIVEKLPPTARAFQTVPAEGPLRATLVTGLQGLRGLATIVAGGLAALILSLQNRGSGPA
ncbi:SDR family oxidoreductase [Fluviibacterium sp. S390]|uniref:SDR family oxidoreductase n=1 Tax=Fluviibacterium sp. S390 TaxID=3415139 RepID=UPI003C7DD7D3